ncbi:unnamed protein product [Schistosoma turkestanicum]|nr:unnamed protein product [Schistosoma turkestanicum]
MSTCSKLYSILKSPDKLKVPFTDSHGDKKPMVPAKRSHSDGILWQCWECGKSYETGFRLSEHLQNCKKDDEIYEQLPGCPYCPRVMNQTNDAPFHIHSFNTHVHRFHPEIKSFMCSYCMNIIHSSKIQDLISHIINTHKIPWRPSPASLAHLRENQLPHRVVTCLGCGWCTFVLRANNAAQPPTSLEAHMNRCSFNGGQVYLTRLSEEIYMSALEKYKAVQESEVISANFAQCFPHVRGFIGNTGLSHHSPFRFHRYSGNSATSRQTTDHEAAGGGGDTPKSTNNNKISRLSKDHNTIVNNTTNNKNTITISNAKKLSLKQQKSKLGPIIEQSNNNFQQNETFFDIPLTIPPPPASRTAAAAATGAAGANTSTLTTTTPTTTNQKKKSTMNRLFVCPLCGDNALSSLRERDEHLQSSHNGELVFPCQICGMAYPLYIALRRHAALQHDSDFDTVRYGPSDLLDCEPIECPECHLVAFQDSLVLKLHISLVHKKLQQTMTLNSSDDSQPIEDSDLDTTSKSLKTTNKTKSSSSSSINQKKPTNLKTIRRRSTATMNRSRTNQSKSATKSKIKRKLSIISGGGAGAGGGESEIDTNRLPNDVTSSSSSLQDGSSSEFERMLSSIDGTFAPASCRYCRLEVDNLKELHLHLELEHLNPDNDIEQLGCQACGRVFFGSGGRIDLIGHLRALHQDDYLQNVLKCPRVEKAGQDTTTTTPNDVNDTTTTSHHESTKSSCKAHFSSPRLRQLHISMANNNISNNNTSSSGSTLSNSTFTCPIVFNENTFSLDSIKNLILNTEIAADQSGIMILAFCCPNCSRLFVGDNVHTRFESHRSTCETAVTTTTSDNVEEEEESIHPMESDQSVASSPPADNAEVSESLHCSTVDLPLESQEISKTPNNNDDNDVCVAENQAT